MARPDPRGRASGAAKPLTRIRVPLCRWLGSAGGHEPGVVMENGRNVPRLEAALALQRRNSTSPAGKGSVRTSAVVPPYSSSCLFSINSGSRNGFVMGERGYGVSTVGMLARLKGF
jgi:hypothetical protein